MDRNSARNEKSDKGTTCIHPILRPSTIIKIL